MTAVEQVRQINKRYWWLSDDRFLWAENTFYYNENIDVYINPKGLRLNTKPSLYTFFSVPLTGKIIKILVDSEWDVWLFTDIGTIRKRILGIYTLVATLPFAPLIFNAIEFGVVLWERQIAIFTNGELFRIGTVFFWVVAVWVYPSFFSFFPDRTGIPVLNYQNTTLYWGSANVISSVDNGYLAISTEMTLRNNEQIKHLSQYQDQFKIYTTIAGSWPTSGQKAESYQYFWNGIGDSPQNVFKIDWLYIRSWVTDGVYDYIYTGFWEAIAKLYIFSWPQKKLVHRNIEFSVWPEWKFVYVGGITENTFANGFLFSSVSLETDRQAIQYYGKMYEWLPVVSSIWVTFPNESQSITAMEGSPTQLFIGIGSNLYTLFLPKSYNTELYSSWFLKTTFYQWRTMAIQKKIEEINVAYELHPAGGSIDIYCIMEDTSEILIAQITDTTKRFQRIYQNQFLNDVPFWNYIWFKFVLNKWFESPILYEVNMTYSDAIQY